MAACWKYCVYLKDLEVESLTPEESEFMKTMEEIDALYEAEMNRARLEGEQRGQTRGEERQKQAIALKMLQENIPLDVIARITELSIDQIQQLRTFSANN
jgi:predicted transposase/invertase (TIGR01784 family)